MKNYNGTVCSSPHSEQRIHSAKSPTSHSAKLSKASTAHEENFNVNDLKHEYTKALNYIDKLKTEQNNLKSTLKMTLEHKSDTHSKPATPQSRVQSARGGNDQMKELENENSDLRYQLDNAMVRLAKLQREKQTLQEKLSMSNSQASSKELVSEIRSLSQEIKVLTSRLQELEEENLALLKQKEKGFERDLPKPSQSLLRYINYVFKLITSMSRTHFARSCFEERFPSDIDTCDLLEAGQFESILLKSFKYITDVLINLNSSSGEESKVVEVLAQSNNLQMNRYNSQKGSLVSQREELSAKRQPSQDGLEQLQQQNLTEGLGSSKLRSPKVQESIPQSKPKRTNEGEQTKNSLQRILGGLVDDSSTQKKPSKTNHSRNHSTTILSNSKNFDSYRVDEVEETATLKKDNRQSESKAKLAVNVEDDYLHSATYSAPRSATHSTSKSATSSAIKSTRRHVRENSNTAREDDPVEKYAIIRAQIMKQEKNNEEEAAAKSRKEAEERQVQDNSAKRNKTDYSASKGKKIYLEDQSKAAEQREEITPEHRPDVGKISKPQREQRRATESQLQKSPGEYGHRSKSLVDSQEIIPETHESRETNEERGGENGQRSRRKEQEQHLNEEDDESLEKMEMWDRKREEYARISRNLSSAQLGLSPDLKGKEYSTFRVSFGRTESKSKKSPSPPPVRTVADIMEVPRKKRVDHFITSFDVLTGVDPKQLVKSPQTTKVENQRKLFRDDTPSKSPMSKRTSSRHAESQKNLLVDKATVESDCDDSIKKE